ncbi:hypothetical protein N7535_001698 [Penicillium sp. DV-2018c]|nr:hypothetical protein N7535_001698 [Penicillium sp. DV-2018c]
MKEVNPRSLMKRILRSTRQVTDYSCVLAGVESGLKHLHPLGLVHKDINPSNITIDNHRTIIIDFGSCRSNDLNALEEILVLENSNLMSSTFKVDLISGLLCCFSNHTLSAR